MKWALLVAVLAVLVTPTPEMNDRATPGITTRDELVAGFGEPMRISFERAREGDAVVPRSSAAEALVPAVPFIADPFHGMDPDDPRPIHSYEVLEFFGVGDVFVFREGDRVLHSVVTRPDPYNDTISEARALYREEPRVSWHDLRQGCLASSAVHYTFVRAGVVLVAFSDPDRIDRKIRHHVER